MSFERALNFGQRKQFSENFEPVRVWLRLVYKFTVNNLATFLRVHLNSK